jgi:peroxiredoxin
MDKKKVVKIVVRGVIGVAIVLFAFLISKKMVQEQEKRQQILELPEMKLKEIGDSVSTALMGKNHKTLIINYFNTHCDFCQHEIKDFKQHLHLFPGTNFMFVSAQKTDTLQKFRNSYSLDSISQMEVYQCKYMKFTEQFGDVVPPTTFVYDSNQRLIKKYKGQIRASVVANDIRKYYKNKEL